MLVTFMFFSKFNTVTKHVYVKNIFKVINTEKYTLQ